MCTVSWLRSLDGYELFCNRDERHTRRAAAPPVIQETRGVRFVAPVDGDHGGSWVGVNEAGVSLCLLNRYEGARPLPTDSADVAPRHAYLSRGLLLTSLMDCCNISQVRARLSGEDLSAYQPFTLAVLSPREPTLLVHWIGGLKTFDGAGEASMPLTSSSYRSAEVIAARRSLLRRMVDAAGAVTPLLLREFHESHDPARGAFSVCMHRDDAATVSFSHVKVSEHMIEFSYQSLSPCAQSGVMHVDVPFAQGVLRAR